MKTKIGLYCTLILICLFICGCEKSDNLVVSTNIDGDTLGIEQDIDKYCKLIELEDAKNKQYNYQLINANGEILYEDTTIRLAPEFSFINDTIIKIKVSAGTNVYYDKYFDVVTNRISEYFYAPYYAYDEVVVSVHYVPEEDDTFLIVQDMFDLDKIYIKEQIDFTNRMFPEYSVVGLEFINDYELRIEYECGESSKIEEKLFVIYEVED